MLPLRSFIKAASKKVRKDTPGKQGSIKNTTDIQTKQTSRPGVLPDIQRHIVCVNEEDMTIINVYVTINRV